MGEGAKLSHVSVRVRVTDGDGGEVVIIPAGLYGTTHVDRVEINCGCIFEEELVGCQNGASGVSRPRVVPRGLEKGQLQHL